MLVCQWHLDIVYGKQAEAVRVVPGRFRGGSREHGRTPVQGPLGRAGSLYRTGVATLGDIPGAGAILAPAVDINP
jgi:hypothetical protein